MRKHYTSIRMAKIQNTDNTNTGKDVGQQEPSFIVNANWYSHFGRQLGGFL